MKDEEAVEMANKETHPIIVPIIVVQGAQYGSEGKGMVAAALCQEKSIDFAVRTGAVNAGHTVYYGGVRHKMQQLPTGWINPKTKLVIGAGAYINPGILKREMEWIEAAMGGSRGHRIYIDRRAGIHLEEHTERSTESGRHHAIGATGKGCSEAIIDKIRLRGNGGKLFVDWMRENGAPREAYVTDTELMLNTAWDGGAKILIEGTQGQMLDLHLGPYPYTTHKQTGPANWLSEVGLSPNLPYEIALVVRTFPIRVAGNSGPLPKETVWEEVTEEINERLQKLGEEPYVNAPALEAWKEGCKTVARGEKFSNLLPTGYIGEPHYVFPAWNEQTRIQYKVAISEFHKEVFNSLKTEVQEELKKVFEFTTVTNKLRRVARLDLKTLRDSIRQTRPDYLVVTFLNYLFPELWGKEEINDEAKDWVRGLEDEVQVEVRYVSTGPESKHLIRMY